MATAVVASWDSHAVETHKLWEGESCWAEGPAGVDSTSGGALSPEDDNDKERKE